MKYLITKYFPSFLPLEKKRERDRKRVKTRQREGEGEREWQRNGRGGEEKQ